MIARALQAKQCARPLGRHSQALAGVSIEGREGRAVEPGVRHRAQQWPHLCVEALLERNGAPQPPIELEGVGRLEPFEQPLQKIRCVGLGDRVWLELRAYIQRRLA